MNVFIIETHLKNGTIEWGIGFNSPDPIEKDYFVVKDKQTAIRLRNRLMINLN